MRVIGLPDAAFPLEPQDATPAHRLPRTSNIVPLGNEMSVPGSIISFAPAAIVTSPVS